MARKPLKRFRWLARIELMSVVVAILVATSFYWNLAQKGETLLGNQTEKLARSLTTLAAFNAAQYIQANQLNELHKLVNALVKENFIFDATIYDHQGITLAQSDHALPIRQLLPMSGAPAIPAQGIGRKPYIATIYNASGEATGYLRITLEESSMLSSANRYIHSAQFALQVMLVMALWVGFVIARLISKQHRRLMKIAHRRRAIRFKHRLKLRMLK
ncbi:AhpA/YtjB family protein [Celerinatantimonas sp. YJH-8]|uniref:AhpA/YtjB family protein n=1 Tax=Celerinatantimonas sp. YJH-8 TaxID=3228714 RepID=UPI0038C5BAF7